MNAPHDPKVQAEPTQKPVGEAVKPTLPIKPALKLRKPRPEINPLQRLLDLSA